MRTAPGPLPEHAAQRTFSVCRVQERHRPRRVPRPRGLRLAATFLLTVACTLTGRGADERPLAAPAASDVLAAEILPGPRRVYVGQRVRLTLRVAAPAPTLGGQTFDAEFVLRSLDTSQLGPFEPQPARVAQDVDPAGRSIYIFEFPAEIVPDRPRPIEIDSVALQLRVPSDAGTRVLAARAPPVRLTVLPVPQANRPPRYTGAVGIVDLEVFAAPRQVRVGDPIELTLDLFGDANLGSLPAPALAAHPRLAADFELPAGPLTGEVADGRRRFTLRIRARHAGVRALPAIEYPYFDPYAERFHVARSAPLTLDVAPAATAPPRAAETGDDGTAPPPLATFAGRVAHNGLAADQLLARDFVLRARHVWIALVGPPVAAAFAAAAGRLLRHRRRQPVVIAGAALGTLLPLVGAAAPAPDRRTLAESALDALAAAEAAAGNFDLATQTTALRAAAARLEALAASGAENATLEHLLGIVYLDLDRLGPAVLHLRRAATLAPLRTAIGRDLNAARTRVAATATPATLVAGPNARSLPLGPHAWTWLGFVAALAAGLLGWGLLATWAWPAVHARSRRRAVLTIGGLLALAAAGLGAGALYAMHDLGRRPPAVVLVEAELRSHRGPQSAAVLEHPLPSGVELRVLDDRAGWSRVRLPGGVTGWLPASVVVRI